MAYTAIDDPEAYFQTKLYTGNAIDDTAITLDGDTDMQPDLIWTKERSQTGNHNIFDSVRGTSKRLRTETNAAEGTLDPVNQIKSFDSDGFTLGTNNGSNEDSVTFVAWNWLAGGSASSNSDGSITSSVSANTTAGFSIVSFTGDDDDAATIGHGLGQTPKFIIQKRRDSSGDWQVTFKDKGVGYLNFATVFGTDYGSNGRLNYTGMTSTTYNFGAGTSNVSSVNLSGATYIAYCFAEISGYSKLGSYTGNGDADGTFIYTGFKPAFILVKDITGADDNWFIWDNKRDGYNVVNRYLRPNLNNAEGYYEAIDILSNGFKNRNTSSSANGSETYIYMAFAEAPFVNSNGVPCNAR